MNDAAGLPGGNRSLKGSKQTESDADGQALSSVGGRAGESAQQMHRALRKDWLQRNRSIFLILAVILILIATVAKAHVLASGPALDGRLLPWCCRDLLGLDPAESTRLDRELAVGFLGRARDSQGTPEAACAMGSHA